MWSAVGNLASIVTIVGFVITIWQLFALKKSVKKSEQAIREVLDDKEYEKLKRILEVTENQLKEVSSLLIKVDKQRFTRGYKRYKETSGLMEWKIGHIFHSIFT